MSENVVVRARINEHVKEEAAAILAAIGLTVSDAFRMLLMRVAKEKALPFEPLVPNKETIAAMKAARQGDLVVLDDPEKLIDSLIKRRKIPALDKAGNALNPDMHTKEVLLKVMDDFKISATSEQKALNYITCQAIKSVQKGVPMPIGIIMDKEMFVYAKNFTKDEALREEESDR